MINYDGKLLRADTPILTAASRAFHYGDGLFETMLIRNGMIRLWRYHLDRLFSGLRLLRFTIPTSLTPERLSEQVLELCRQNTAWAAGRIRLTIFRGEGGLFDVADPFPHYVIESTPLSADFFTIDAKGLAIDVFPDGRKACDGLANLKSNNYLLYVLAAEYAKSRNLDDSLVLNCRDRVADSTIANLFYVQDGRVFTPPLSEGCVAGVMRRHLLEKLPSTGFPVEEKAITAAELLTVEELFLTNALRGIRWVASFGQARYTKGISATIYRLCLE